MTRKYEAHITFDGKDGSRIKIAMINWSEIYPGWKYSIIDGDPVLGDKVFCYLSRHSDDFEELKNEMTAVCGWMELGGIKALRMKIEEILYDARRE